MKGAKNMLVFIKWLHTIIWTVMVAAIVHMVYAGWSGHISFVTYIAIGLITLEIITLLINKWTCPLTPWARRYTDDDRPNFDIYLPEWIAKYNKEIFGTLLLIGVIMIVWRLATN